MKLCSAANSQKERNMNTYYTAMLAMLTGVGLGAVAVQGLNAQVKPSAYVIAEIDVTNQDGYVKEYLGPAEKAILAGGGKYLARGSKTASIKGEPPKRIVVQSFETLEAAQAAYASPAFQEAFKIGEKYAKFRVYAVEAAPPK
jgi:uncharacterized protein (DUF1330 family)